MTRLIALDQEQLPVESSLHNHKLAELKIQYDYFHSNRDNGCTYTDFIYLGQNTTLTVRHQVADDMATQGCNYTQAVKTDILWIIKMWVAGMSAREIAGQMGISVRTVHRRIRRLQTDGILASRPYRGRLNISLPRNSNAIKSSAIFRPAADHNAYYCSFFQYPQLRAEVWP